MSTSDFELKNENGTLRGKIINPEDKPKGVLLCLHGGPNGDLHGNTEIFDQIACKAEPLGYATIMFSLYGSLPSDGSPKDISLRTQLTDYNSVFQYAIKNFKCPIHIVGESAGVTIAALEWKSEPKSYILLWPAFSLKDTDLKPYFTEAWWKEVDKNGFLNDNGVVIGKEFFIELSLKNFEDSFKLPGNDILILHGQSDKEVPFSQSLKALANANGTIVFVTTKDAGHGFQAPKDRSIVLEEISKWLTRY